MHTVLASSFRPGMGLIHLFLQLRAWQKRVVGTISLLNKFIEKWLSFSFPIKPSRAELA